MNCRKQDFKERENKMAEWKNVTDTFSEEQRHYNGKYLEIDEVYNDEVEVSVFSADDEPYEIYFSYDKYYGIVYAEKEKVYEIRDEMKQELQAEYDKSKMCQMNLFGSFLKNMTYACRMIFTLILILWISSKGIPYSTRINDTGTGGKVCTVLVLIAFPFWIKS